jgi:hypothetical protein
MNRSLLQEVEYTLTSVMLHTHKEFSLKSQNPYAPGSSRVYNFSLILFPKGRGKEKLAQHLYGH